MTKLITITSLLAGLLLAAPACGEQVPAGETDCADGKCDTPGRAADAECRAAFPNDQRAQQDCRDGKALDHCEARRADALDGAQKAFVEDAIRWAAADVSGVNTNGRDDRGQEYAEYFAVVVAPPEQEGGATHGVTLGQNTSSGQTRPDIDLSEDQIFALEDEPDAVTGQCVFTSWHADVRLPLPACDSLSGKCPSLEFPEGTSLASWITSSSTDVEMNAENLQMKVGFNSNSAASDLAQRCMTGPLRGDQSNPADELHDNFTRGCMKAYEVFGTEWRRSDSSVCVVGGRLAECGCGVDTDGDGLADITDPKAISLALVPRQPLPSGETTLRGFPFGTWSGASELPAGCSYAQTGDDSQTIVTCDLSASDVLAGASDVKERCRSKYGSNVVVHVPIPKDAIVCNPPAGGQYSGTCDEMPWVVTAENSRAE